MVHALKPNPKSPIQENWRILDFFSHHPKSLHMFTFLFDDVGVPQDYRHMEGSGVNTCTLINKAGKIHYVKFHWKPTCGVKCPLEEDAIKVGGANHSHATQDLYDSIAAGNYPEWKLFIQVIDPDLEDRFDFDPLDVTKTWPEDILPLQPVGRTVLNKNIDNFFAGMNSLHVALLLMSLEFTILMTSCFKQGYFLMPIPRGTVLGQTICSFHLMPPNVPITTIIMKVS